MLLLSCDGCTSGIAGGTHSDRPSYVLWWVRNTQTKSSYWHLSMAVPNVVTEITPGTTNAEKSIWRPCRFSGNINIKLLQLALNLTPFVLNPLIFSYSPGVIDLYINHGEFILCNGNINLIKLTQITSGFHNSLYHHMAWTQPLGRQCGFSFLGASSPVQKTPLSYQKSN